MKTKKRVIYALLALICLALLAGAALWGWETAQTANVKAVSPARGRLTDEIALEGEIYFKDGESYTIEEAAKLNLYIERVETEPGSWIHRGDVLLRASVPGHDAELEKLTQSYEAEVRKYAEKSAAGLHFGQSSPHNDYYNAMMSATEDYWDKLYLARAAALAAGEELAEDITLWKPSGEGQSEEQKAFEEAVRAALLAKERMEAATATLKGIYDKGDPVPRLGDAYFSYIKELDGLKQGAYRQLDALMDFERRVNALKVIRAEADGWLSELNTKAGEVYDGSKPAWRLSEKEDGPFFRCDISGISKQLKAGMRARLKEDGAMLSLSEIEKTPDGKSWALFSPDEVPADGVGSLMGEKHSLILLYEAEEETALLPAAALHLDSDGQYFVWTASEGGSSLSGLSGTRAARQNLTVIETSGDMAATRENLTGLRVLLGEDRALSEGQRVLIHENE